MSERTYLTCEICIKLTMGIAFISNNTSCNIRLMQLNLRVKYNISTHNYLTYGQYIDPAFLRTQYLGALISSNKYRIGWTHKKNKKNSCITSLHVLFISKVGIP